MNADCAGGDATPCIPVRPTDRPTADSTGQAPTPASRWVREGFAQSSLPPSLWQRQRSQRIGGTSLLLCLRLSLSLCPLPLLNALHGCSPAQRYQSGWRRSRNLETDPARVPAGAGYAQGARGATGLDSSLTCHCADMLQILELTGLVASGLVPLKFKGYAGAGGLAGLQPRHGLCVGLGYPCLGQHNQSPSCPVLPPCWASMLALLCWSCWAGHPCWRWVSETLPTPRWRWAAGLAVPVGLVLGWAAGLVAVLALGCWPCCFAGAGCTVGRQGRRGTPQSLRGERG